MIFVLGVVVGLAISYFYYNEKIRTINSEINTIENGFKTVINKSKNKEIKKLNENLEHLIEKLKQKEEDYDKIQKNQKQIISSISHDMRTPLTSILGYIDLLEAKVDKSNKKYIDIIRKRTISLNEMVESFYELSMLDEFKYEPDMERFSITDLLIENMVSYKEILEEKNIEVDLDIDQNIPNVVSDRRYTERIFQNLIKNAIKYAHKFLKVRAYMKDQFMYIEFENDWNSNINPDILFERYYKEDDSRSENSSGLGLSIVKKLSEILGIDVRAYKKDSSIVFELKSKI